MKMSQRLAEVQQPIISTGFKHKSVMNVALQNEVSAASPLLIKRKLGGLPGLKKRPSLLERRLVTKEKSSSMTVMESSSKNLQVP